MIRTTGHGPDSKTICKKSYKTSELEASQEILVNDLHAQTSKGALSVIICKLVAYIMFLTFLTKLSFLKITSQRSVLIFHPFMTLQTKLWKNYQFSKSWIPLGSITTFFLSSHRILYLYYYTPYCNHSLFVSTHTPPRLWAPWRQEPSLITIANVWTFIIWQGCDNFIYALI